MIEELKAEYPSVDWNWFSSANSCTGIHNKIWVQVRKTDVGYTAVCEGHITIGEGSGATAVSAVQASLENLRVKILALAEKVTAETGGWGRG